MNYYKGDAKSLALANTPVHQRLYLQSTKNLEGSPTNNFSEKVKPSLFAIKGANSNLPELIKQREQKEAEKKANEEKQKEALKLVHKFKKEKEKQQLVKRKIMHKREKKHMKEIKEMLRRQQAMEEYKEQEKARKREQIKGKELKIICIFLHDDL